MPVVNIVGDHATYHKQYDAQLESDIETVARNVSSFHPLVGQDRTRSAATRPTPSPPRSARPVRSRRSCCPPTSRGATAASRRRRLAASAGGRATADDGRSGDRRSVAIRRAGRAARRRAPRAGERRWSSRTSGRRRDRRQAPVRDVPDADRAGRGPARSTASRTSPSSRRCSSTALRHLVLVDAKAPVSFFAYPDKASWLVPDGLRGPHAGAGADDADGRARRARPTRSARRRRRGSQRQQLARPELPDRRAHRRPVPPRSVRCCPRARSCPTKATRRACSQPAPPPARRPTTGCASRAARSARACRSRSARPSRARPPGDRARIRRQRDVHAAVAVDDGARRSRRHDDPLQQRLVRGAQHGARPGRRRAGPRAKAMLDIRRPDLDFVALARGLGVPATRADTAEEFNEQLERSLRRTRTDPDRSGRSPDHLARLRALAALAVSAECGSSLALPSPPSRHDTIRVDVAAGRLYASRRRRWAPAVLDGSAERGSRVTPVHAGMGTCVLSVRQMEHRPGTPSGGSMSLPASRCVSWPCR